MSRIDLVRDEEVLALLAVITQYGPRKYKRELSAFFDEAAPILPADVRPTLQRLRNRLGPSAVHCLTVRQIRETADEIARNRA